VRWRYDGDCLLCRSTSYFWDRLREIPNRYLRRWAQDREANGWLPLADFLEMATLSDQQLDSARMSAGIRRCWKLGEWGFFASPAIRQQARLLATLTADQRRRALQREGLPFQQLTPTERQSAVQYVYQYQSQPEKVGGKAPS